MLDNLKTQLKVVLWIATQNRRGGAAKISNRR